MLVTFDRNVPRLTTGVYFLRHVATGQTYVGSSKRCVINRLSYHTTLLKYGAHCTPKLQRAWNETSGLGWEFVLVERCSSEHCRERENYWISVTSLLLNAFSKHDRTGTPHSEVSKEQMRMSRAKYLETPGARESLSERAKRQHAQGRLGAVTRPPDKQALAARRKAERESRSCATLGPEGVRAMKRAASMINAAGRSKTGYRGVGTWPDGRFCAYISGPDKKKIILGRFDTAELAAAAYDAKSRELFGDSAYVNLRQQP